MAQGRESPTGYDWEDSSDPAEPAPFALPDRRRGEASQASRAGQDGGIGGTSQAGQNGGIGEISQADEDAGIGVIDGTSQAGGPGRSGQGGQTAPPYGAPAFTYDLQEPAEEAPRRGALPAWAIVAVVIVQAAAMVAIVGLVMGGLQRLTDPSAAPPASPSSDEEPASVPASQTAQERKPGTVTDSAGRELSDGTGGFDRPATIGEHTVSWTAWTGGTLSVTPLEVDLAATAPGADGKDVVQPGYRLVLVTYQVRYDGPGQLAPAEELWLTGESDRTYFPDIAEGLVPDPMKSISPLGGGESAQFHSAFLVPEGEVDTFRLGVETFSGEILYFATG